MAVVIPIETKYNPRGTRTAIRDLDSFKTAVDKAGGGFRGLAQVSGRVMQSVGRNISNVGATLSRNVTLPLVALGAGAVVAFNAVDEGLDTVAAKSGATGKALQGLQGVFTNVAKSSTQDMQTVGNVVGGLAGKLQITGKPLQELSTQLLTLARVTGADAQTTTENVSTAMVALGIDASKAGGFLDSLLTASQRSGKGVDELAKLVATGAGTFATYGIGTNEALGLIGELSRAGIPTTRVMAGLNTAFKKLRDEGIKDMPAGLRDVFAQIKNAKSPTEATSIAVDIFGSRVGVTLADAIRTGKVTIEDLTSALAGSEGALASAAKAVEGPQERFARLKNEVMLLGASFVEELLPVFEQYVMPIVRKVLDAFQGLSPQMKLIIVIGGLIAAALGPLLAILGGIITGVGALVTVIGAISGPVAAVIAGVAAFVGILVLLWTTSENFRNAVIEVFNSVRAKIIEVVDVIKSKFEENRSAVASTKDAFMSIWSFIKDTLAPLLVRFYGEYLKALIEGIGTAIGFVIDVFQSVLPKIVEVINLVKQKLDENRDAVEGVKKAFQTVWEFLQTTLIPFIQGTLLPLLVQFYGTYLKKVIEVIGFLIGAFIDLIGIIYRFGQQVGRAIAVVAEFSAAMRQRLTEVIGWWQELPGKIVDVFRNAGTLLYETGRNIVTGLWNGIQNMSNWLRSSLMNWVKSVIPDPVERILGIASPSRVFEDIGSNLVLGLVEGLDEDGPRAVSAAQDLGRQIETDSVHVFEATGRTLAQNMGKAFTDAISPGGSVYSALQSAMDALAQSLSRTITMNVVTIGGGGGGGGGDGIGSPTPITDNRPPTAGAEEGAPGSSRPFPVPGNPEFGTGGKPGREMYTGGFLGAGQLALVGERGPELFQPTMSGRVIPNGALGGVTVEAGAVQVIVNGGDRAEVQQAVDQAFQRLVRELAAL